MTTNIELPSPKLKQIIDLVRELSPLDKDRLRHLLEKDYREQKLKGFLTDFQTDELTLEEITQEVEAVRQEIYIQTQADV